jgi:hypothetical protein
MRGRARPTTLKLRQHAHRPEHQNREGGVDVRAADADVTYDIIAPEGDEGEVGDTGPLRAQVLYDSGLPDSRREGPLVHLADRVVVVGPLRTDGEDHSDTHAIGTGGRFPTTAIFRRSGIRRSLR